MTDTTTPPSEPVVTTTTPSYAESSTTTYGAFASNTIISNVKKDITALEKFKGLVLCILVVLFCFVFVSNCLKPKVVTKAVTDTKETDLWKSKYTQVVKQLNKEIAKHVNTTITTVYRDNPKTGAEEIASITKKVIDNSTINSQSTSTSTMTVTEKAKTIETIKTVTKYSRTAIMLGCSDDGLFKDIVPNLGMQVDNYQFTVGYGIIRKEWDFDVKTTLLAW